MSRQSHEGSGSRHFSNIIDLRKFFDGVSDYVVMKLPEHFPNYYDYQDLDILCKEPEEFQRQVRQVAESYLRQGFRIKTALSDGHFHIDIYAPEAPRLNFRFDLISSFDIYRKFRVSPDYFEIVMRSGREIFQNGAKVVVPSQEHELVLRFLEYLEYKEEIPSKSKHWDFICSKNDFSFIPLVNRFTNLSVTMDEQQKSSLKVTCREDKCGTVGSFFKVAPTCQIPGLAKIYEEFFGKRTDGCFVEFGAFDGEYVSNTSGLADMGWTGYYVEPVPEYYEQCKQRHAGNKGVTVSRLAIGADARDVTINVGGPLSTISDSLKDHFGTLDWSKGIFRDNKQIQARQIPLHDYLSSNMIKPGFELLVVDVEGHEWEVFRNFDIQKWLPQMIIIELHDQNDDYLMLRGQCLNLVKYFEENGYVPLYKDRTNTVYVPKIRPKKQKQARMDFFMIWGHGLRYTDEIISMIRNHSSFEITTIVRRRVQDIGRFIRDVYACDTVPFHHLVDKTRYLLETEPEFLFILVRNLDPREKLFGEGEFRHIQCETVKELKEEIRDRFNPRNGARRSENHVIHASDYPAQVEHMLGVLGLPPLSFYTREVSRDLEAPYHLQNLADHEVVEVKAASLYATILGRGIVPLVDTPHYLYVAGDKLPYEEYHREHMGIELTDDHFPAAFDRMINDFRYGTRTATGKRNLIIVQRWSKDCYGIVDGVHRAAILTRRGAESFEVAVIPGTYQASSEIVVEQTRAETSCPKPEEGARGAEETVAIIFSKDRPLQLDATLRSLMLHCQDFHELPVKVVIMASNPRAGEGYRLLQTEYRAHDNISFLAEKEFRLQTLGLLGNFRYVLWLVDDCIFIRDFCVGRCVNLLEEHDDALGYSLRLGENTTYCYPLDRRQAVPDFRPVGEDSCHYCWVGAEGDFGYPLEVSSSVYRTADLLPLLHSLPFHNPNSLEGNLAAKAAGFTAARPALLCSRTSAAFSNPINKVQITAATNRAGTSALFSPESLLDEFLGGSRVDVTSFSGVTPNACHAEIPLVFTGKRDNPKVSVIIPCYKQAHFLAESVGSVVDQTFSDWECLIINDGSPDDTSAVAKHFIRKYPNLRIRLLEKPNGGLADARNYGVKHARGNYILPLDADDLLHPEMLKRTVEVLEGRKDVAIAYVDMELFGASRRHASSGTFHIDILKYSNPLPYCSLYRRNVWESVGGYNANMTWGYEDWDFWVGAGEIGFAAWHVREALFCYRVKTESMYTDALLHDAELKARIVCNHPRLYSAQELLSALDVVWRGSAAGRIETRAALQLDLEKAADALFSESGDAGMTFVAWLVRKFPGNLELKQRASELVMQRHTAGAALPGASMTITGA